MKAVGILVPVGTSETSSQMLQIIETQTFFYFRAESQSATVFQLARRQRPNRLKTKTFGRGGGDRKDRQTNKACALYVLQPPPLANWNKRNKRQAQPSQVCRAADAESQQQLSVWLGLERSTTRRLDRLAGVVRFRSSGLLLRNSG